jgi:hypothetical protein
MSKPGYSDAKPCIFGVCYNADAYLAASIQYVHDKLGQMTDPPDIIENITSGLCAILEQPTTTNMKEYSNERNIHFL